MKPEDVRPAKFRVHIIVYNNNNFSVAYGVWENGEHRLAMRWNGGEGDGIGYPNQGGNPLWFQLPDDPFWTSEILRAVDNINAYENRIEDLENKMK